MLGNSIQQLLQQIQSLEGDIENVKNKIIQEKENYELQKLSLENNIKETLSLEEKPLLLPFNPKWDISLTSQEIESILQDDTI
jgi:TolA-binding protein